MTHERPAVRTAGDAQTRQPTAVEILESSGAGAIELAAARLAVQIQATLDMALRTRGLSQRELAERLGASEGRVSQVMNGDGNLRVATIGKYLRALGYQARLQAVPAEQDVPALVDRRTRRVSQRRGTAVWREVRTPDGRSWAVRARVRQPAPGYVELTATALQLHADTPIRSEAPPLAIPLRTGPSL